jgi:Arc/MetJ family transcription regulator
MPAKLDLDERLIEEAKKAGHHKTNKEAVTAALNEYIKHQRRLSILELAGTIDFDPAYDYKAERKGKR